MKIKQYAQPDDNDVEGHRAAVNNVNETTVEDKSDSDVEGHRSRLNVNETTVDDGADDDVEGHRAR